VALKTSENKAHHDPKFNIAEKRKIRTFEKTDERSTPGRMTDTRGEIECSLNEKINNQCNPDART